MTSIRFSLFAARDPNAIAIVDADDSEWSRGRVAALSNQVSRTLRRLGLAEGEVLGIMAPNGAEFMVMYLAATQIGLRVVAVNWHLAPAEIAYILEDSQAKALFAHERFRTSVLDALTMTSWRPPVLLAHGDIPGFLRWEDAIAGAEDSALADPVVGRTLFYTSATTGRPKGVKLSIANASAALDQTIQRRVADGTELENHVFLCASMLYHGAPLEAAAVALHMGHTLVVVDRFAPEHLLRLIERYRVTLAYMIPSTFSRLLRLSEEVRNSYSTASLRRVVHTGAPCPIEVKRQMLEWWGPVLWEVYAGAEGGGTMVGPKDWLEHPGTVGKALPGSRLKILNDDGEELAPGQIGTIYMTRSNGERFEYSGDSEKTRSAYHGDFFTLGDVGYLDAEGYLFICDRKADMIISYGMNIYSAEIERVLATHPKVKDCAIIGAPHDVAGEIVVAVVQVENDVEEGRKPTSDILAFLGQHLGVTKLPRRIVYTSEPLRNATGKISKQALRDRYVAAASRDVRVENNREDRASPLP